MYSGELRQLCLKRKRSKFPLVSNLLWQSYFQTTSAFHGRRGRRQENDLRLFEISRHQIPDVPISSNPNQLVSPTFLRSRQWYNFVQIHLRWWPWNWWLISNTRKFNDHFNNVYYVFAPYAECLARESASHRETFFYHDGRNFVDTACTHFTLKSKSGTANAWQCMI